MKRREFFKLMGLTAGAALTACTTNDADKKILPYLVPPEDGIIPGVARYIRSTCTECPAHCGLDVKIRDDQPIKLEGNPDHPVNRGTLCVRGQASLERLYHPRRLKNPLLKDSTGTFRPISWDDALTKIQTALNPSGTGRQHVFLRSRTTGSLNDLIETFCRETGIVRLNELEIFNHGAMKTANQMVFGLPRVPYFHIDAADVVITLRAPILETFISPVEWTRQYAENLKKPDRVWFHLEPYVSLTGASADHRVVIHPGSEAVLLAYLLRHITPRRPLPLSLMNRIPEFSPEHVQEMTGMATGMIGQMVRALDKAKAPLIINGDNGLPAAFYTSLLQWTMGMIGTTVDFDHAFSSEQGTAGNRHPIGVAIFSQLRGTPWFPEIEETLKKATFRVAFSEMSTPLTEQCDLVLPLSTSFESWGDVEPRQGLRSVIQPSIEPQSTSRSEGDILLAMLRQMGKPVPAPSYREYLTAQWKQVGGMDENWITRGFKTVDVVPQPVNLSANIPDFLVNGIVSHNIDQTSKPQYPFLFVVPSLRTYDGRSSDLSLLSEIPDPLTAISYGKWVTVSSQGEGTDHGTRLSEGDGVAFTVNGSKVQLPVMVHPGCPPGVMTVSIDALNGSTLPYDPMAGEWVFALGRVKLDKVGKRVRLTTLSGGTNADNRGILAASSAERPRRGSYHYERYTLYPPHGHTNYRWGMVIDLDACTGCSACVAACYVENNVPVVGPKEHARGREMSWIRLEPFNDRPEKPEFLLMLCQHCDCAPCENVCPVYATYHNPEGLNIQVYNRCVGTRYCSNNCPYKVRRFNWFSNESGLPLVRASNPDVSVRPKGIMEKCTFCSQRIRLARDQAEDQGRLIRDGEAIPACAQTCPAHAISFGNVMDPDSEVAQRLKSNGMYRVLEELGTESAVHYIRRKRA
ncbi:MAG: 4Fe-4S dicluster domain-containing protein [Candidatus Omnitrophota bacterium]